MIWISFLYSINSFCNFSCSFFSSRLKDHSIDTSRCSSPSFPSARPCWSSVWDSLFCRADTNLWKSCFLVCLLGKYRYNQRWTYHSSCHHNISSKYNAAFPAVSSWGHCWISRSVLLSSFRNCSVSRMDWYWLMRTLAFSTVCNCYANRNVFNISWILQDDGDAVIIKDILQLPPMAWRSIWVSHSLPVYPGMFVLVIMNLKLSVILEEYTHHTGQGLRCLPWKITLK
jgi:hypothetical protein